MIRGKKKRTSGVRMSLPEKATVRPVMVVMRGQVMHCSEAYHPHYVFLVTPKTLMQTPKIRMRQPRKAVVSNVMTHMILKGLIC
jgi:hypothetical protein